MVAKFLDDNNREFLQRRRRTAKKHLCTCITLFCTFLSRCCTTATFTRPLYIWGRRAQHRNFVFLFLNLYTLLSDLTQNPGNFANIWQIKWNHKTSMKFETVRIHFLSDVLVCCHSKVLLPWHRDVTTSPLYSTVEIWSASQHSRWNSPASEGQEWRLSKVLMGNTWLLGLKGSF